MLETKPATPRISEFTVRRLSVYRRILENLEADGVEVVSSAALAEKAGTNPAQIRKDLSYFGSFGKRGKGYRVADLNQQIKAILGLLTPWKVVLAGAGNLGHALCSYKEFGKHGFNIVAVFDIDPEKVGREWEGVPIRHMDECSDVVAETGAQLAIITTPGATAADAVQRLREAGIRGFLNFAPRKIDEDDGIHLRYVNLTIELEGLTYALNAASA